VAAFETTCTRCERCLDACPQDILIRGDGGFPEVDFSSGSGECTFCAACVEACPEPAFTSTESTPWQLVAEIADESCLARAGIHCQSCADVCGFDAIAFALARGLPPQPVIDGDACTGCGACVSICPADAIATSRGEARRA
jgi:ferredoxin-type protein NapF